MKATHNSPARPAQGAALADLNTGSPAQLALPPSPPVVNVYLTGCNINNGGQQIIGHSNTLAGGHSYGGADLYQIQADTIRAQAATIAAQQRTIDHLLAIIEGMTARDR